SAFDGGGSRITHQLSPILSSLPPGCSRLAFDALHDDLLITVHSDTADQILRYHIPDGKRTATYGSSRHYGLFNPLEWGGLLDLAADGAGGFFTVESSPRRVAHFQCSSPEGQYPKSRQSPTGQQSTNPSIQPATNPTIHQSNNPSI